MRTIGLFAIVFSLHLAVLAQKTISGVVSDESGPLPGVTILNKNTAKGTLTDFDGKYTIEATTGDILLFSFIGMKTIAKRVGEENVLNVQMESNDAVLEEVVVIAGGKRRLRNIFKRKYKNQSEPTNRVVLRGISACVSVENQSEHYKGITENTFKRPQNNPFSTFSVDVDNASYSNIRRMINNGQKIPKDAVKIEEMINYFKYDYSQPTGKNPFAIHTEVGVCPWNQAHYLMKIGLQGKEIPQDHLPPSNLVFLIDVSGSMDSPNKLPLLKKSFKLLVNQLREQDKIAIVVYAGAAGLVLPPTSGAHKQKIIDALNNLQAGGSTAGGAGIQLAYKVAEKQFKAHGNNRVILATDGDFNVGESSDKAMEQLIEEKRKSGVYLTVLGFGMGNYKDAKLETLADKGNGNHAYIDTMQEAQRILVKEFGGTLFTIAKDVKIQVEFNPAFVQAYRLIGYENRLLEDEDFLDDTVDAGEIGSGHKVTALYEIIPMGVSSKFLKNIPEQKYAQMSETSQYKEQLATIKFRYKNPKENVSRAIIKEVPNKVKQINQVSPDFLFAGSIAMFGMQLRNSKFKGSTDYKQIIALATQGKSKDTDGYRAEFIRLAKTLR